MLEDSYDGAIAFESLPISLAKSVIAKRIVAIIGDPVGSRLWYSTPYWNIKHKILGFVTWIVEALYFKRRISPSWQIAMFGTKHAMEWSRRLGRPIINLRPMIPDFISNSPEKISGYRTVIAFGGTLASTASKQALKPIFHQLIPLLRKHFDTKSFELRLIGECPLDVLLLAKEYPEVVIKGRVDSFETALAAVHVFILPMDYPVGVRTRICSALSAGNACVVHSSILINMPELADCKAVCVVDNLYDYPSAIFNFVMSSEYHQQIRASAKDFFKRHYVAEVSAKPILEYIHGGEIGERYYS
jgi:hypothetical protein